MNPESHPSHPAESALSATVPRSTTLLMAHWAAFFASFAFPALALAVIPVFEGVFQSFGTDLPGPTVALMRYRLALVAVPVIAFVPALAVSLMPTMGRRAHVGIKLGLLLLVLLLSVGMAVAVVALYLPMLRMVPVV